MKSTLTMLGTGNAAATKCYNTCFVISTPQSRLLVDAGGGNGINKELALVIQTVIVISYAKGNGNSNGNSNSITICTEKYYI